MSDKYCGTCKHIEFDKQSEDFVCSNSESDNFAEWVDYTDECEEWEEK